ncbi:MAG: Na(+)/H(+) antiporter subunit B [Legionellaceae bacterium]|nr:Na(+)/H(+) antiporter subunit B [Legionellaceae bacterium]|tara:strand:- start:2214 stop:2621 length:408 start_codon:yes stop_codon:yes gene_type:complete
MNSIILKTASKYLLVLLLIFSLYALLRGHNEPGGGFIGGLIAASAFSLYLLSHGPKSLRKLLKFDFHYFIIAGLCCVFLGGFLGLLFGDAFLTGEWIIVKSLDIAIGTPLLFDLGVYLIVIGSTLKIITALEEKA